MAQVETARGPIDVARLGTTLMHEHVFVLNEEIRQNYPSDWDEEARIADAGCVLGMDRLRSLGRLLEQEAADAAARDVQADQAHQR